MPGGEIARWVAEGYQVACQVWRGARLAGAPWWSVIFRGDFQRNNQEKVRKKLRSTAQLLAHLAAGLALLGLQRIYPLKYYDRLRNFLRSMALGRD